MDIVNSKYELEKYFLGGDDTFPNSRLPVLHYKGILKLPLILAASSIVKLFEKNRWRNCWKNGIYEYHHYHSITHEALGIYKGDTELRLGGNNGITIRIAKGDVVIIPAGVAHKNEGVGSSAKCVGAYPDGMDYDIKYGKAGERPQADENISKVPMPAADPIFGPGGDLHKYWKLL
jgi:uncharacterized protein YjlB